MTETTFVTAIRESTGKTAAAVALGLLARDRGESVGYMKPKGTRVQSTVGKTIDPDPLLARELLDLDDDVAEMEPIVYSPTFVRGAIRGGDDDAALAGRVREAYGGLAEGRDRLVVEGGGSWFLGGVVDLTDPEIAELLDARVILMASYDDVADVDPLLAAADAFGERLAGVVFNAVPDATYDEVEHDVAAFLESRGLPVLGVLPRTRELAGVTVADLADHLGAQLLTDVPTDAYVERLHVGAMGGEAALRQFRRTTSAAVVTGGDRADIHTAAIQAGGVKCLILTGGFEPTGAVLGRAEAAGLPVLVVRSDTITTLERAEDLVDGGRVADADSVDRMQQLLVDHADVDAILEAPAGWTGDAPGDDLGDGSESIDALDPVEDPDPDDSPGDGST